MGKNGGGQNTVVQQSQPPAQFLQGYENSLTQAQNVAGAPLQQYPAGSMLASLSPDQLAGIGATENLGGIANPYLSAASGYFGQATQPLINGIPTLGNSTLTGAAQGGLGLINQATGQGIANAGTAGVNAITGATNAGVAGVTGAANAGAAGVTGATNTGVNGIATAGGMMTPGGLSQWENPYTQQVVQSTEQQLANVNAQQQSQLQGNAIASGAFGGDRAAVAQSVLAGQQAAQEAPTIAGLESQGYTTALGALQSQAGLGLQAATAAGQLGETGAAAAGQLGLSGAGTAAQLGETGATAAGQLGLGAQQAQAQTQLSGAGQELGLLGQQQQVELGANEANAWLASQAGFGNAQLGQEAENLGLANANALLGVGSLEQQQAQEQLNIPYEQFEAQQAYPFQTTGWLANIAEGMGGAAGGTSSTTYPGASIGSQLAGGALGATGLLGETGAFGSTGYLTGALGLGSAAASLPADFAAANLGGWAGGLGSTLGAVGGALPFAARGGPIRRAGGGGLPAVSLYLANPTAMPAGAPSAVANYLGNPTGAKVAPGASPAGQLASTPSLGSTPGNPILAPYMNAPPNTPGAWGTLSPQQQQAMTRYANTPGPQLVAQSLQGQGGGLPPVAPQWGGMTGAGMATGGVLRRQDGGSTGSDPEDMAEAMQTAAAVNQMVNAGNNGMAWGGHVRRRRQDGGGMGDPGAVDDPGDPGAVDGVDAVVPAGNATVGGDPWKALMYAGMGIMGGRSPNALSNIGEGALQGLHAYAQDQRDTGLQQYRQAALKATQDYRAQQGKRADQHEQAYEKNLTASEDEKAAQLQAQIDHYRQQASQEGARIGIEQAGLGIRAQEAATTAAHDKAMEGLAGSAGTWEPGTGPNGQPGAWFRPSHGGEPQFHAGPAPVQKPPNAPNLPAEAEAIYNRNRDPNTGKPTMTPEQALSVAGQFHGQQPPAAAAPAGASAPQPVPGPAAFKLLQEHPELAPKFIERYGAGAYKNYLNSGAVPTQ